MVYIEDRKTSLDIIRIIAVCAVIMVHTCDYFLNNYNPSTSEFVFGNIFDSLSRIGVPLFVMVSGALMLDEKKKKLR